MPDKLKMNYNLLNDAKRDLHQLADDLIPSMDDDAFQGLGDGTSDDILGSSDISYAVYTLHSNASYTMGKAKDGLTKLGDSFGSVGEAFLQFDAEIAQGMNATNSSLALSNWQRNKDQWDHKQSHLDECVGDKQPEFCGATDPGAAPLDQTIVTDRGNIHTHLTLDDKGNVIKEETTVTYDGKTYASVTTYDSTHNHIVTDSTYPDGSTVHNVTDIATDGGSTSTSTSTDTDGKVDTTTTNITKDGSGTQTVTNADGTKHEFTRGADDWRGTSQPWVETPESVEENDEDDDETFVASVGV
ncbi:hypothetical protein AB0P21_30330 [Kribbella sp. NPDC056861]|uniref:hypothetical protein n=1 Tax=Kribbella sp. NPDC056861 TaxID=3154857 RepID=UPI003427121A